VSSIVGSYQAIVVDLETSDISSDPVDNGILKNMNDPTTLKPLLLLADTLPHITALSLVFQCRDVNLGMVKTTVDTTIKILQTRKTQNGPWQLKYSQMSSDINLTNTLNPYFKVKEQFLTQFITNISDRFMDTHIIDQLAVMDFSGTSVDLPALYGYTEMHDIAAHFSMDLEDLQLQWQILYSSSTQCQHRTDQ
jgi:hypothetical protein